MDISSFTLSFFLICMVPRFGGKCSCQERLSVTRGSEQQQAFNTLDVNGFLVKEEVSIDIELLVRI